MHRSRLIAMVLTAACLFGSILSMTAGAEETAAKTPAEGICQQEAELYTAEKIVETITETLAEIDDLSAHFHIVQHHERRTEVSRGVLFLSQVYGLARVELQAPRVMEGQIVVACYETMQIEVYLPVSDNIMVREVSDIAAEQGIAGDVYDLPSMFDFEEFDVTIEETIKKSNEYSDEDYVDYVLRVSGYEDQVQYVWVRHGFWIPHYVEVYAGEKLAGTLELTELEINAELNKEHLSALPDVERVYY